MFKKIIIFYFVGMIVVLTLDKIHTPSSDFFSQYSWSIRQFKFDRGFRAYGNMDYKTALREWTVIAEFGHIEAQYNLGVMNYSGKGVEKNYKEAIKWFKRAAEGNHVKSQYNLGSMYSYGLGVDTIDHKEALKWYRKAAEQGDENALLRINSNNDFNNLIMFENKLYYY